MAEAAKTETLLEVNNIEVIYNHVILVLKGVSLNVPKGGITALLGGNGAGKTTTLKAISSLLQSERGEVTKGSIMYKGRTIEGSSPSDLVKSGVIQVMEGRHCFEHLTIEENLLTGAYTRTGGSAAIADDLEMVYNYFPRLRERRKSQAGYTSGGEQQMCAIGRALMSRPEMILLDEPSMGLAPQLVEEIFTIVKNLNEQEGVSFLLAEQNTNVALVKTPTSKNSIWACLMRAANRSAMSGPTDAARGGWHEDLGPQRNPIRRRARGRPTGAAIALARTCRCSAGQLSNRYRQGAVIG